MGVIRDFIDRMFNRKSKMEQEAKDAEKAVTDFAEQKKKEAKASTTDVINVTELKKEVQKDNK